MCTICPPAARAAAVLAGDATFCAVLTEQTALVRQVLPYRPGEFFLRELPPLRAVLAGVSGLSLLVIDGYADLDPAGRPGPTPSPAPGEQMSELTCSSAAWPDSGFAGR